MRERVRGYPSEGEGEGVSQDPQNNNLKQSCQETATILIRKLYKIFLKFLSRMDVLRYYFIAFLCLIYEVFHI